MTPNVMQKTGLAVLTAAALFGAAQVVLLPSHAGAQTPVAPPLVVAPASAVRTLSATGIGQVPGDTAQVSGGALMLTVEERSKGSDVQAAVKTVQDRIAKLTASLKAAGVPESAIHVQGFNIGPNYGYAVPMPAIDPASMAPSEGGSGTSSSAGGTGGGVAAPATPAIMPVRPIPVPPPAGYSVNAQLMVDTTGPEQLATAMRVAIDGGATNVNSFIKGGPGNPTPPASEKLAPATQQATEQAKVMAEASAKAAGVTLGEIRTVTVHQPTPSFGGGPGPIPSVTWQVQVTVAYDLK
ncbi:MAG: SIMPL domain-containing protein [Chloroflexota bacterium]